MEWIKVGNTDDIPRDVMLLVNDFENTSLVQINIYGTIFSVGAESNEYVDSVFYILDEIKQYCIVKLP